MRHTRLPGRRAEISRDLPAVSPSLRKAALPGAPRQEANIWLRLWWQSVSCRYREKRAGWDDLTQTYHVYGIWNGIFPPTKKPISEWQPYFWQTPNELEAGFTTPNMWMKFPALLTCYNLNNSKSIISLVKLDRKSSRSQRDTGVKGRAATAWGTAFLHFRKFK